jgi:hypothetical protein
MKNYIFTLAIAFFCLIHLPINAQDSYATIEKNVNVRANELFHDLNKTKDTLLLKSDKKINYVYSLNSSLEREVFSFIDDTSYEIPLNRLSKGKHTFVVGQSPLKIVFIVRVNQEPTTASVIREEDIVVKSH